MSLNIWGLLQFNEIICPSCGSSWYPSVGRPLSCPRCKSYTVSKNRQSWPEGYKEVSFSGWDFVIDDPEWKRQQEIFDHEQKTRKRAVFSGIVDTWNAEFAEEQRKKTVERIIHLWKVDKQPTKTIASLLNMKNQEVCEILVAEKVAVWEKNPHQPENK
jgi:hypothetical protein